MHLSSKASGTLEWCHLSTTCASLVYLKTLILPFSFCIIKFLPIVGLFPTCYNFCHLKTNHALNSMFPLQLLFQFSACLTTELFGNVCQHLQYWRKSISEKVSPPFSLEPTPVRLSFHCSTEIALSIVTTGKQVANSSGLFSALVMPDQKAAFGVTDLLGTLPSRGFQDTRALGTTLFTGCAFQCSLLVPSHLPHPSNLQCPKLSLLTTSALLMHSYPWWSHPGSWL